MRMACFLIVSGMRKSKAAGDRNPDNDELDDYQGECDVLHPLACSDSLTRVHCFRPDTPKSRGAPGIAGRTQVLDQAMRLEPVSSPTFLTCATAASPPVVFVSRSKVVSSSSATGVNA